MAALVLSSVASGQIRLSSGFALGIAMMAAGVAIRMASAQNLGGNYTLIVGLRPGQEVCDRGLYRWVRHPGYAGTMIAMVGLGIALMNWFSVLAMTLIVPALVVRIALEERMLTRAFAPAYEAYCRRTRWRVLPGVI
jgi:protein-S-isoprenylcysteine O-methyltransferase Ste14